MVTNDLVMIGSALVGNTTVKDISLDLMRLDEGATVAFARGIRYSQIKELTMANLTFGDRPRDRQRVARILCNGIQNCKTIEKLTISNMGEYISLFLDGLIKAKLPLKHFESLGNFHTRDLIRSLQNNTSLMNIQFQNQGIDDQDVSMLLETLHPDIPLVTLGLTGNKIGPIGVQALLQAMAHHPTWCDLDLEYNRTIGFDGLRVLGEELQTMHLHGQPDIGITMPKFISVNVCHCVRWKEYKKEKKQTEEAKHQNMARHRAEQALLDGMKDNVLVIKLQPHENYLSDDTWTKIKFYRQLNQMGRYLLDWLAPFGVMY